LLAWVHGQWMSTLLGQHTTAAAFSCRLPASAQDGPLDLRGGLHRYSIKEDFLWHYSLLQYHLF
jgi:hypothetical protein